MVTFIYRIYEARPLVGDVAIAEPSFCTYLGPQWLQPSLYDKPFSNFTFGCGKILSPTLKFFQEPLTLNFPRHCKRSHGKPVTKAVISLEARSPVLFDDGQQLSNSLPLIPCPIPRKLDLQSSSEELEELDEKEKLRRMRISKANRGKLPWNKGRKHSAETVQRIKERTRLAMQNPKVKSCSCKNNLPKI